MIDHCIPVINVLDNFECTLLAVLEHQIFVDPANQVVLERPLDYLV